MTKQRELKRLIRERQAKTGEAYTTARLHVLGACANGLGDAAEQPTEAPQRVEAVVLKVGETTARIRIVGETDQVTVPRSSSEGAGRGEATRTRAAASRALASTSRSSGSTR
jgi:hypothetical protein